MAIFKQTDKLDTKQLPCTFPGCENQVIVNKFYTPSKARCPEHTGKTVPSVRIAIEGEAPTPATMVRPSVALGELLCPVCNQPMTVVDVDERLGWPTLRCPSPCGTVVEIKPHWGALRGAYGRLQPGVKEPMRALLEALNADQRIVQARQAELTAEEPRVADNKTIDLMDEVRKSLVDEFAEI